MQGAFPVSTERSQSRPRPAHRGAPTAAAQPIARLQTQASRTCRSRRIPQQSDQDLSQLSRADVSSDYSYVWPSDRLLVRARCQQLSAAYDRASGGLSRPWKALVDPRRVILNAAAAAHRYAVRQAPHLARSPRMRAAYGASSGLLTLLKTPRTSPTSRVVALPLVRVVIIGCLMQEVAERIRAEAAAAAELATEGQRVEYLDGAGRSPTRRGSSGSTGPTAGRSSTGCSPRFLFTTGMQIAVAAIVPYPKRSGLSTPST
jgi:hypothetical protein